MFFDCVFVYYGYALLCMQFSHDFVVDNVPSWGLFVDVDEFVASHPDWSLFSVAGQFGMRPAHGTVSDLVSVEGLLVEEFSNMVAVQGVAAVPFNVANAVLSVLNVDAFNAKRLVPVGFHARTFNDSCFSLEFMFVFAAAPELPVMYASSSIFDVVLDPFLSHVLFVARRQRMPIVISTLSSVMPLRAPLRFVAEDGLTQHTWLHDVLSVSCSLFDVERQELSCLSVSPGYMVSRLTERLQPDLQRVAVSQLSRVSNDLSRSQNDFRLIAGSLFASVPLNQLLDAAAIVFDSSFVVFDV